MSWEEIADKAAARYTAGGGVTLVECAGQTYYRACQAGWEGHMGLWFEEVYSRATGESLKSRQRGKPPAKKDVPSPWEEDL